MAPVTSRAIRVVKREVTISTLAGRRAADYADEYELTLDCADAHTAEQWARTALEQAHPLVRRLIRTAHTRVLRFNLAAPNTNGHVFGWRIERVEPQVIVLATGGPAASAALVGRRLTPTSTTLTSFLWFDAAAARHLWRVVGPVHRKLAPYLLRRAAETFIRAGSRDTRGEPATVIHGPISS